MDENGIKSHSDTTPAELSSCLKAVLVQLEPEVNPRAWRALWSHALAVRQLDREGKAVTFSLPATKRQIAELMRGTFPGKLTKACMAVGLQSWEIIPGGRG